MTVPSITTENPQAAPARSTLEVARELAETLYNHPTSEEVPVIPPVVETPLPAIADVHPELTPPVQMLLKAKSEESAELLPPIEASADSVELPGEGTKKCPMCGEWIKLEARICRYCRTRFEVAIKGYCTGCHDIVLLDDHDRCPVGHNTIIDRHVESQWLGDQTGALLSTNFSTRQEAAFKGPLPISPALAQAHPMVQQGPIDCIEIEARRGEGVNYRFSALIVDDIIVSFLYVLALFIFISFSAGLSSLAEIDSPEALTGLVGGAMLLFFPMLWLAYFTILEGTYGATPGKATQGLKVIRKDGSRCGYGRAAIRALFSFLEANPLGAIVIWATHLNQRLGDLVAGTLVVSKHRLTEVSFSPEGVAFRFHDSRQVDFAQLTGGHISKFGALRIIHLEGMARGGKLNHLALRSQFFPNRGKMDQLQARLESFFHVRFAEEIEWWRIVFIFLALAIIVLLFLGIRSLE